MLEPKKPQTISPEELCKLMKSMTWHADSLSEGQTQWPGRPLAVL